MWKTTYGFRFKWSTNGWWIFTYLSCIMHPPAGSSQPSLPDGKVMKPGIWKHHLVHVEKLCAISLGATIRYYKYTIHPQYIYHCRKIPSDLALHCFQDVNLMFPQSFPAFQLLHHFCSDARPRTIGGSSTTAEKGVERNHFDTSIG